MTGKVEYAFILVKSVPVCTSFTLVFKYCIEKKKIEVVPLLLSLSKTKSENIGGGVGLSLYSILSTLIPICLWE